MEGEQPRGTAPGKSTKSSTAARGKGREPSQEPDTDMEMENEGARREPDKEPPQGRSGLALLLLMEPPQHQLQFPTLIPLYKATLRPPGNFKLCFSSGQKGLQRVKGLGPVQVQKQFVRLSPNEADFRALICNIVL